MMYFFEVTSCEIQEDVFGVSDEKKMPHLCLLHLSEWAARRQCWLFLHGRWWQSMCGPHHRCVQLAWQPAQHGDEKRPSPVYVTVKVTCGPTWKPTVCICDLRIRVTYSSATLTAMLLWHGGWISVPFAQPPVMGYSCGREQRVMYWKISLSAPLRYLS